MASTVSPFGLPPEEAIKWFREKGYALNFDWRDMWGQDHARFFSVAKATQLDLLADIHDAVDKAIAQGQTLQQFTNELHPQLEKRGWWGKDTMVDPLTQQKKRVQLGSPRRLKTIYETNLRMAMAAGRWERAERLKKQEKAAGRQVYLRYVCIRDGRERDEHRAWHGLILPIDDKFWETHAPPNGWGCRCKVMVLTERDVVRYGFAPSAKAPAINLQTWVNDRAQDPAGGPVKVMVPKGIDPGFEFNPGKIRGRGGNGHKPAEPIRGTPGIVEAGRLPAAQVTNRPPAPAPWPAVHGPMDEQRQRERFRALFNIQRGEEAVITTPLKMQVHVSEEGFLDHLLLKEPTRTSAVPIAKHALEDPYEIWLVPERLKRGPRAGQVVLRLRYIGLYPGADHQVVIEREEDGYVAWTTYEVDDIDKKREGQLLYSRPEKKTAHGVVRAP